MLVCMSDCNRIEHRVQGWSVTSHGSCSHKEKEKIQQNLLSTTLRQGRTAGLLRAVVTDTVNSTNISGRSQRKKRTEVRYHIGSAVVSLHARVRSRFDKPEF